MKWKKLLTLRRNPYFLTILILCVTMVFFYARIGGTIEEKPFQVFEDESITKFLVDTPGCQIPDWDPWDPSVKQFYKPIASPYQCEGRPSFLKVEPNGVVSLDDTIMQFYYEIPPEQISCNYTPIYRDGKVEDFTIDFEFKLGPSRKLEFGVPLQDDFLRTECLLVGTDEPAFIEYLTVTPLKNHVESKKNIRRQNLNKLFNIMFIGIDSISSLQFERHFPKCLNFLKGRPSTYSLRGYTKVGDNTFPNLTPLLTGHFYQHYWDDVHNKTMFFDDVDFLWRKFSDKGYRTLFAEDAPTIATYNYYRSGFKNPPTDYYYRPFALAVENSEQLTNKYQCIGNKMEMQVIFDYLKSFVTTMNHSRPFFSFTFLARLTHDYLNQAGYADEPSFQLLRYLENLKITDNTIIVFFSDHGIRFGPIRKTYIGQIEERMPFMYLIFPKWFSRKYPELSRILKKNQERLTTPFDIHATMLDLLNFAEGNFKKDTAAPIDSPGISLFQEITNRRTCQSAWIAPHWCTCQIEKLVSIEDKTIIKASIRIVNTLNQWTQRLKDKCATLKLEKIHNARVLKKLNAMSDLKNDTSEPNEPNVQADITSDYIIMISTVPGSGLFEATVRCNNQTSSCNVLDVSRINRYGTQSACIDDVKLKKYCYCS